ncbi:Protein CBG25145 [Caenorhabditis briggsae]|uniref:Protein CBG25145 n=1 Tax=Caenorhabditis briggsae TaxID=6238 RepID=A8WNV4_CAEBR|nr:Protein CBG25145 [Caenorhabditis briggsae]CAP22160.1 Protein CBG25145 [Caenorhabditis briggsae]
MEDCIPQSGEISDPEIYTFIFHILTIFMTPIHVYGTYCIFFKTPSQMTSVKWLMLNCHFWNVLLDLSICFLSIPYIFHPTFSGIALGVIDFPELEVYLVITLIGLVTISIWSIHENRYHVLFGADNNPIWCLMRKPMMLVNYFAAITYFIPPYFVLPDQNQEFVKIQEILPCNLQQAYASRKVFILSAGKDFPLYCCFVFYVLAVGQSIPLFFIIIIKLIRKSRKKESTASLKTLKMRKKLVIALIIQTISPCLLISIPVEYLALATYLNYYNTSLNRFSMILFGLHGVCSTLTMIFVHQPYREATVDNFYWLMMCRQNSKKISVAPTTMHS